MTSQQPMETLFDPSPHPSHRQSGDSPPAAGLASAKASLWLSPDFGADVVIADKDAEAGEQAADEVSQTGRRGVAITTDVRDFAQVQAMVAATVEQLGKIDILVNNAGGTRMAPVLGARRRRLETPHRPQLRRPLRPHRCRSQSDDRARHRRLHHQCR